MKNFIVGIFTGIALFTLVFCGKLQTNPNPISVKIEKSVPSDTSDIGNFVFSPALPKYVHENIVFNPQEVMLQWWYVIYPGLVPFDAKGRIGCWWNTEILWNEIKWLL